LSTCVMSIFFVSKLLRVYPADDILILYNSAQFMDDKDISKLK